MPLSPGDKLGPYEIVAPLGAGGMGEVYRARDAKLNRDVAIKVLPAALSADAQYMARFEREAQMLAALNHPNIATVYGIEQGALFMELIEGADLKGPLPIDEALAIARQIGAGLEAAHEKGIIHRDLKPANIKLTPAGVVKILDFGLAKSAETGAVAGASATMSPTLSMEMTRAGMILGTAGYMSPEQARGKPFDKRTDIWAFGVVLYEIITGKRLFEGEDLTETLASVVKDRPDLTAVPAKVRPLLERCLEKDPKKRLRDIGDMEFLLAEANSPAAPAATASPARFPWMAATAALALAAAGASSIAYRATRPAPLRPLIRLNAEIAPDMPLASARSGLTGAGASARIGGSLAVSPDGARLVVTLRGTDGKVRIYTRLMNQSEMTPLAGTDEASYPFFSPGGEWIGFFADNKLKKVSVEGGATVTLCDAPYGNGASWGDDGNIIAALNFVGGLSRIPSAGGTPAPVTKLTSGEATHRRPQVLPGSQAILFTSSAQLDNFQDAKIEVISLPTGERKTLVSGGYSARYLPSSTGAGQLIYLHQSTLFAVPFDASRLAASGSPAPILEDVASNPGGGGDFAFGQNGTFVYLSGEGTNGWSISWVDRSGKTQPLETTPGQYHDLRFSPDGKRLAYSMVSSKGSDIWVKDLDRDTPSRISFLPGANVYPVWAPDGKTIVFASSNGAPRVFVRHPAGRIRRGNAVDRRNTRITRSKSIFVFAGRKAPGYRSERNPRQPSDFHRGCGNRCPAGRCRGAARQTRIVPGNTLPGTATGVFARWALVGLCVQ
ncbi:MAG: protein kinase domain-containing protein [Bryobacteraceae bacterium]